MTLTRFIETTFFAEGKNIPLRFFSKILILMMPKYSKNFRLGPLVNKISCKKMNSHYFTYFVCLMKLKNILKCQNFSRHEIKCCNLI